MDERRLELKIRSSVIATDGDCGHIQQLVLDPHNRRVTAFVVHGDFPDLEIKNSSGLPDEDSVQTLTGEFVKERHIVLPDHLILYESESAVFLSITGKEAAGYRNYDDTQYAPPPAEWQPSYPYRKEDILFKKQSELIASQNSTK